MKFALYDVRIYAGYSLIFHTYYHTNQLPFYYSGMSDENIREELLKYVDKLFVREERFMNVAECLVTVFGCDFRDPLPIDQRYFKPYMIKFNQ